MEGRREEARDDRREDSEEIEPPSECARVSAADTLGGTAADTSKAFAGGTLLSRIIFPGTLLSRIIFPGTLLSRIIFPGTELSKILKSSS